MDRLCCMVERRVGESESQGFGGGEEWEWGRRRWLVWMIVSYDDDDELGGEPLLILSFPGRFPLKSSKPNLAKVSLVNSKPTA